MLNPRTKQIMYAAYNKIGVISHTICLNLTKGKNSDKLYEEGIKILRILKVLFKHVRFENNKIVLYRIEETEVNQLIACLIRLADLENYPIQTNYIPVGNKDIKIPIRNNYNA
jgi:hypothetical protein